MKSFLDAYLAGTPDTCPPLVKSKLVDIGPLGSTPKAGAQASAMLTTAVHPLAYSWKIHGGLTPENKQRCKVFTAEQLRWRWSSDTTLKAGPQPFATDPHGNLLLNDSGDPIPVQKWDAQHADVDTYLCIAAVSGEALPLFMAVDIVEEMAAAGEFSPNLVDGNTRRHTSPLRMLRSYWLATKDQRTLHWAKAIFARLAESMSEAGEIPYLTVNGKEESDPTGDHGGCGICTPWHARAAQATDEWGAAIGALSVNAVAVRDTARECIEYARKHPAVTEPNTLLADYSPTGKVNYFIGNAMDRWSLPALAAYNPEAAKAWYLAADWTLPTDTHFMAHHNAGITIKLAGQFGWRA